MVPDMRASVQEIVDNALIKEDEEPPISFAADFVLFISLIRFDLAYQWRFGLGRRNVRENYPVFETTCSPSSSYQAWPKLCFY
jgi:hypothetical protein